MIEIDARTMILFVLMGGAKHGYVIMGRIGAITNGDMKVSPGTLYRALSELCERGYIEEVKGVDSSDDERRRYYQITDDGRHLVRRAIATLRSVLAYAEKQVSEVQP